MPGQRVRQACERCREKKSKCTGEKPICSFCLRLSQRCVYLQRSTPKPRQRVSKSTSSAQRVHQLETQVKDLYDFIGINDSLQHVRKNGLSSCERPPSQFARLEKSPSIREDVLGSRRLDNMSGELPRIWTEKDPEPPSEVVQSFVDIYNTRVYFQPLPLFRPGGLNERIRSAPQFLRFSFFAVMLHYNSHEFFASSRYLSQRFYRSEAQQEVDRLSKNVASLEVIQALCLLALSGILQKDFRAWTNIGTATRLEALRRLILQNSAAAAADMPTDNDDVNCYWSVHTLEKAFSPQISTLGRSIPRAPKYPRSPQVPTRPATSAHSYFEDLATVEGRSKGDAGINALCLRAISAWGNIVSYLQRVRAGISDTPWTPTSVFGQLTVELFELEADVSHKHFFRNVLFVDRNREELDEYREYWAPWFLLQIILHAGHALLNHPFIHLVALNGMTSGPRPRVFLQQTTDQALYHSRWVARLLETARQIGFEVCDPLIGGIVMATATISWIFQFTRDSQVSQYAKDNFSAFESLLERLVVQWPHLKPKSEILQQLQATTCQAGHDASKDSTLITFQPRKVWTLIDTSIIDMVERIFANSATSPGSESLNTSATLRVATTFIHPVADDTSNHNHASVNSTVSEEPYMDISLDMDSLLSGLLTTNMSSTAWAQFQTEDLNLR